MPSFRDNRRPLHRRRTCQRAAYGSACQPYRGGCQQSKLNPEGRMGRVEHRSGRCPPRTVREYLDTLDEAAFGAASEVQPKFTSHSAPQPMLLVTLLRNALPVIDSCAQRACFLQLFGKWSYRHGSRCYFGRRRHPFNPASWSCHGLVPFSFEQCLL